jgi:hypothetical protein
LVSLDIVKRVWAVILAVIRERLLSIPGKLADALANTRGDRTHPQGRNRRDLK